MAAPIRKRRTWNSRGPLGIALLSLIFLILTIGVWGARANIAGAVMGTGRVEASQTMTAVQHPIGGVIEDILATNGDMVKAGDVVLRLDDTQLRSDLNVVEGDLFEALANIARLTAEIEGRQQMDLHPVLAEAAAKRPEVAALLRRQQRQLDDHFDSLAAEASLLDEQIVQVRSQISGIEAQVSAKEDEADLIAQEMDNLDDLAGRGLLKLSELFTLKKTETVTKGEIGKLEAQMSELRAKIAELDLKRHTIEPNSRKLAVVELSKLRPEQTRYLERRATIMDGLTKLDIRSPISGRVHDSKVLGLRSVVVAASPLMMIIPDQLPTLVMVRINATDIDQVFPGQEATLKFRSFNGRYMPIILGRVSRISADVFKDPVTRKDYYEVLLTLDESELAKLGQHELLPGMPVEAFLSTESRSPLNYVLRPLMAYFDRAFRDA